MAASCILIEQYSTVVEKTGFFLNYTYSLCACTVTGFKGDRRMSFLSSYFFHQIISCSFLVQFRSTVPSNDFIFFQIFSRNLNKNKDSTVKHTPGSCLSTVKKV